MTSKFNHTARPPAARDLPKSDEFYFGKDHFSAKHGIGCDARGYITVRHDPDDAAAWIFHVCENTVSNFTHAFELEPQELRELARCLIDAAEYMDAEYATMRRIKAVGKGAQK